MPTRNQVPTNLPPKIKPLGRRTFSQTQADPSRIMPSVNASTRAKAVQSALKDRGIGAFLAGRKSKRINFARNIFARNNFSQFRAAARRAE